MLLLVGLLLLLLLVVVVVVVCIPQETGWSLRELLVTLWTAATIKRNATFNFTFCITEIVILVLTATICLLCVLQAGVCAGSW
jgi:hypothetical protein